MGIVKMVEGQCLALAQDNESKAFFHKMVGDYYRYVAESATEDKIQAVRDGALKGYS